MKFGEEKGKDNYSALSSGTHQNIPSPRHPAIEDLNHFGS